MLDPKVLDDLARKLADSVPPGLKQIQSDMEKNFQAVLQSGLARMNLVTREEFDVQAGVLARTREKLEAMAERVEALEKRFSESPKPARRKTKTAPPKES